MWILRVDILWPCLLFQPENRSWRLDQDFQTTLLSWVQVIMAWQHKVPCPNPSSGVLALVHLELIQNNFPRVLEVAVPFAVFFRKKLNSQLIQLINVVLGPQSWLITRPKFGTLTWRPSQRICSSVTHRWDRLHASLPVNVPKRRVLGGGAREDPSAPANQASRHRLSITRISTRSMSVSINSFPWISPALPESRRNLFN